VTGRIHRFVRVVALAICGACVIAAVAAPMPGYTRHVDRNSCSKWFSVEPDDCVPDYHPMETTAAAGGEIAFLLVPMAVFGALVAWRPRRRWAALWSSATLGITFAIIVATFDLDLDFSGDYIEHRPASYILQGAVGAMYALHVVQLITLGIHAIVVRLAARRREREAALDPMPRAVVVKD
jgi:hypothetical protein